MIKVENRGGNVAFQAEGTALDLAQEVLSIRQFVKQNPEVEQMANLIEIISNVKKQDFESIEELEKEIGTLKEDGMTLTEDVLKKAFGKKMN
nr:MAG TPA: PROTEIN/RNA Complex ribosomal subunit, ribonucleoprotein, ribosomal [Caudoviricetes sp.]